MSDDLSKIARPTIKSHRAWHPGHSITEVPPDLRPRAPIPPPQPEPETPPTTTRAGIYRLKDGSVVHVADDATVASFYGQARLVVLDAELVEIRQLLEERRAPKQQKRGCRR